MSTGHRRRERGTTLLTVTIVVAIVAVAITNHVLVTSYATLSSLQARHLFAVRQAALDRVNRNVPASSGGSLHPAAPVEGWADTVCLDPETGAFGACDTAADMTRVLRQWRVGVDGAGNRVFEVSAVAVSADGAVLGGRLSANASLSRRVSR